MTIGPGMDLVETHAHLDFPAFDGDVAAVLSRAEAAGVKEILNVVIRPDRAERTLEWIDTHPRLYAAVGIHPHEADDFADRIPQALEELRTLASHPKVLALGEAGLDFYRRHASPASQVAVLEAQRELAESLGMPLIIHCREAEEQLLSVLEGVRVPVLMHCFSGKEKAAAICMERGYFIGLGGVLTFPSAEELREVVRHYPRDRVVLETDSPYLAPQPVRGRRNEPAHLVWVVKTLADIWDTEPHHAAAVTSANARALLGLTGNESDD